MQLLLMQKVSSIPGEEERQPSKRKGNAATVMLNFKKVLNKLQLCLTLSSKKYLAALSIPSWWPKTKNFIPSGQVNSESVARVTTKICTLPPKLSFQNSKAKTRTKLHRLLMLGQAENTRWFLHSQESYTHLASVIKDSWVIETLITKRSRCSWAILRELGSKV